MAIQDKGRRRDILAGRVVNPDVDNNSFSEDEGTNSSLETNRIEGRTIGGAGSVGTGDVSGDFDRAGTEGTTPENDYVERDIEISDTYNVAREDAYDDIDESIDEKVEIPANVKFSDPASGFPGGGALRSSED